MLAQARTAPVACHPLLARSGPVDDTPAPLFDELVQPASSRDDLDFDGLTALLEQLETRLYHRGNDDHRLAAVPGSSSLHCPGCQLRSQAAALRAALADYRDRGLI
jgi:hypothetical protein